MKNILFAFILDLISGSCSKKIDCIDPPIEFAFISYSSNDIDTLVIRKFSPNNNFQVLIDTVNVFNNINAHTVIFNDTIYYTLNNPNNQIKPDFDWQIYIPATNRTIEIANILKDDKTGKCGALARECFCYNNIQSIKIDNQIRTFNSTQNYTLFFHQ